MLREPSLLDLNENLQKMADKLMNCDLKKEELEGEIERANALVGLADKVVSLYETENHQLETQLHMAKIADSLGYMYVPEAIQESDKKQMNFYKKQNQYMLDKKEK